MNTRKPALHAARMRGRAVVIACSAALCCIAARVHAQPANLAPDETRSTVSLDEFQKDVTNFSASFGGALSAGNTQAVQGTVGSVFGFIRDRHAFDLSMDFAYGRARPNPTSPVVDTARNLRSRGRYALYLSTMDALYVSGVYRWDTFAGLDARLQGQVGYMRNLYVQEQLRLWAEVGYDLTYENYDPDPVIPGHKYIHSARLFLGYSNQINPMAVVQLGVEGLLNVEEPSDSRVNGDLAFRSVVIGRLQLELKFILQVDTKPQPHVPALSKYDGILKLNLIYTLI